MGQFTFVASSSKKLEPKYSFQAKTILQVPKNGFWLQIFIGNSKFSHFLQQYQPI
jgi:hypothetical protein